MVSSAHDDLRMTPDSGGSRLPSKREKIAKYIREKNLLKFAFLFFVCSFFFTPFEKVYKFAFYFSAILFLLSVSRADISLIFRSWIFRALVLWIGYLTLTLAWTSELQLDDLEGSLRGCVLVLLFFLVTMHLVSQDPGIAEKLFVYLACVSAATALVSMLLFYSRPESNIDRLFHFSVLSHPISAAFCYGVVVLLTFFGLKPYQPMLPRYRRWLIYISLVLMLAFVFLTATRGAILGLACSVIAASLLARNRTLLVGTILICVAIAAASGILGAGSFDFLGRGSSHRLELWAIVMERIGDNFWLGNGIAADASMVLSSGMTINHSHQLFLGNHFYGGVPATLLLLSVLAFSAISAFRAYRKTGSLLGISLLVYVVAIGLVDVGEFLRSPNLIWFYFWFPLAIIAADEVVMISDRAADGQTSGRPDLIDSGPS